MPLTSAGIFVALCGALAAPYSRQGQLPITERGFLTGTTATLDRTNNPSAAFALSRQVGRVTMLWLQPTGRGLFASLSRRNPATGSTTYEAVRRLGLVPVINLNPWTVQAGKGIVRNDASGETRFDDRAFMQALCQEARDIARAFRPTYFSIGNEVNSVYEQRGAEAFRGLARLEEELYRVIKKISPETKVLVVLSYSQLVDLPGAPRWQLISGLAGSYDVLGLTSYPWKRFSRPSEIPADYYRRVQRYTDRPIAFTEIGWTSDGSLGGSEEEQEEFLICFLERTRGMKLEFVNWAFLHDLPDSSVTGIVVQRSHMGLGLRRYDGSAKKVWDLFRTLAQLPETRTATGP